MADDKRVTLKRIAEELGISVSVVSRVLNGKSADFRISASTEEAVRKTAARLNYSPNTLARGLRLQASQTLGVTVPDISNPFFARLVCCIERHARAKGYSIILADSQEDQAIERESLHILRGRRVDGLIVSPVGQSPENVAEIARDRTPCVLVDRYFPELKLPYVTSDNFRGAFDATRLLIEHGHRRIGFVQGLELARVNIERLNGYKAALREHGIKPVKSLIRGDQFSQAGGYKAVNQFLELRRRPTALILAANQIALGGIEALCERGIRVPESISLVSFDEHPYSPQLAIPLTTVAQQEDLLASSAVELLERQLKDPDARTAESITVPTYLVERNSVRRLAPGERPAAAAG